MTPPHWLELIAPVPAVGEQVDDHVFGAQGEDVVAGSANHLLALLPRVVILICSTVLIRNGSMMVLNMAPPGACMRRSI